LPLVERIARPYSLKKRIKKLLLWRWLEQAPRFATDVRGQVPV
jgi:hypothetical protein